MTPATPQPQREYRITEAELNELALYFREHKYPHIAKRGGAIISQVSDRPHTPAPEQKIVENCKGKFNPKTDPCYHCPAVEVCPIEQDEIDQKSHDAAIARTATLATLDELMQTVSDCDVGGECAILKKIESLRHSTTAQEVRR